jgi:glycosyltransferase involved in cell wall biosynthesis
MRSAVVCAAQAPFVTGGAEILVRGLAAQLERRGFAVEVVALPFHAYPPTEVVRQALAWRLVELRHTDGRRPDLVIATKFPSYLVEHPNKVAWLFHQYREAYDLFGTPHSPLTGSAEDSRLREDVRAIDGAALGECRRLFAISRNVAGRLRRFNKLPALPLYPPPPHLGRYHCEAYGDQLLWAGRLEAVKRPGLAIRALAASGPRARLTFAGRGPLEPELRRLAQELGVAERVRFLGFVSDAELLSLYACCRAVLYAPVDEDYGYVPVEGYFSRHPTLTTSDAGGTLEFVEDGVTGLVRPAEPQALADAIDAVYALDEASLREMGEQGHSRVAAISWDAVIDALAGDAA